MEEGLKRVLIVAYYWPPAGGPGVQRWLKFAKYLPEHGWAPTLVVPEGAAYPVLDPSLEQEVDPDLEVVHVPIFEPYDAALSLFRRKGAERLGSGNQKSGLVDTVVRWVRGNVLLPDPRVLWRRPAVRAASQVLDQARREGRPFSAMVTTGPPHSVHLIGRDLKRRHGLTWVADFRDPWREMDYLADFLPSARTKRTHLRLEGAVVRECDSVLMTSKGIETSLAVHQAADKLHLIPNGWDEADLPQGEAPAKADDGRWHLGHFGSVFPIRNAPGLWQAVARWNRECERPIHLDFFGVVNPEVAAALDAALPNQWTDHGYVSHREAVAAMQSMDALLMLQNRSESGRRAIPGKAFEYLALGKPLAVVTPSPSDLTDLIGEWGFPTIGYDDAEAAFDLLQQLHGHPGPEAHIRQAYTRTALTQRLSAHLNDLASR